MTDFLTQNQEKGSVRFLQPPSLDKDYLGKKIICQRAIRQQCPAFWVEKTKKHSIAHNYGYGGSGWTLAPGAAHYIVQLLQQKMPQKPTKTTDISVIGAGVLGLFTALELLEQGYKNITILAEQFQDLPSHHAGALLAPAFMEVNADYQPLIHPISLYAYRFYHKIATQKHPLFSKGASLLPLYIPRKETERFLGYVTAGVMKPAQKVTLDFGNGTTRPMAVFDEGIFINTGLMMETLTTILKPYVTFINQKISDLSEIHSPVVFNCTGLSAKTLVPDSLVKKAVGHLILLKNQDPQDWQYMLSAHSGPGCDVSDSKAKRFLCAFPKHIPGTSPTDIGVIGGTYKEEGAEPFNDEEEFDQIIQRLKIFYGI